MGYTLIDTFGDKALNVEYSHAKILADPYNYSFLDKVICAHKGIYFKYTAFSTAFNTEMYLCNLLEAKFSDYMNIISDIKLFESTVDTDNAILSNLNNSVGHYGTMCKHNNLVINESILLNDLHYVYDEPMSSKSMSSKVLLDLKNKNFLKALEYLQVLMSRKESLIPNLMYLCTEFGKRPLSDLENITFAQEALNANKSPIIKTLNTGEVKKYSYLAFCVAPFNNPVPRGKNNPYNIYESVLNGSENVDLMNAVYTMGLNYTMIYGYEILYILSKIKSPEIKDAVEELLSFHYNPGTFCERYLYSINSFGNIVINKDIEDCFDDDPEVRFNNFREHYFKFLKADIIKNPCSNLDYYGLPIIFSRLISNAHNHAFKTARVKHIILMYSIAKKKALINPDSFKAAIDCDELFSTGDLPDAGKPTFEEAAELLSLDTDVYNDDEGSAKKDSIEYNKDEESAPALSEMDALKTDLHGRSYDYDVNYVVSKDAYKEEYFKVAKTIKLITQNLIRQIKNIKVYNTGGKQSGLYSGKLDKKNLWKYNTDHKIFYNNNYKLKEMDLAFGCVLDESGSMHGEKIKNGRIVMIMLHEVLSSLGINHSIIGHTSRHMYQCKILKYYQFKEEKEHTLNKPYSLLQAEARSGNCDSGALHYMHNSLKSVKNKDKIVIIFSDGQPTECTGTDLKNKVKEMENDGIHVIGVGINFSSIAEYYNDYANGKNLKEMVDIVVSILKRYVLEKKED